MVRSRAASRSQREGARRRLRRLASFVEAGAEAPALVAGGGEALLVEPGASAKGLAARRAGCQS